MSKGKKTNQHYNPSFYKKKRGRNFSKKPRLAKQVPRGMVKAVNEAYRVEFERRENSPYAIEEGDLPKLITKHKWILTDDKEEKVL